MFLVGDSKTTNDHSSHLSFYTVKSTSDCLSQRVDNVLVETIGTETASSDWSVDQSQNVLDSVVFVSVKLVVSFLQVGENALLCGADTIIS